MITTACRATTKFATDPEKDVVAREMEVTLDKYEAAHKDDEPGVVVEDADDRITTLRRGRPASPFSSRTLPGAKV